MWEVFKMGEKWEGKKMKKSYKMSLSKECEKYVSRIKKLAKLNKLDDQVKELKDLIEETIANFHYQEYLKDDICDICKFSYIECDCRRDEAPKIEVDEETKKRKKKGRHMEYKYDYKRGKQTVSYINFFGEVEMSWEEDIKPKNDNQLKELKYRLAALKSS